MRGEHNHFIDQKGASFRLLIVIRLKFNKMLFFLSYKHFFSSSSLGYFRLPSLQSEKKKQKSRENGKKRLLTDKKINLRLNFSSGICYKTSFKNTFRLT